MSQDVGRGFAIIQQQLAELDTIVRDTMQTLNTVSGMERVARWKARTVALLTEAVGQQAGQTIARLQPGPSFSNDLVEEFTDSVETFRAPLVALSKTLSQAAPRQPAGG
jgi:hypothetical protein